MSQEPYFDNTTPEQPASQEEPTFTPENPPMQNEPEQNPLQNPNAQQNAYQPEDHTGYNFTDPSANLNDNSYAQENDTAGGQDEMDPQQYFMRLLNYLEDTLTQGSTVPFTNKRMVNTDMCLDIVQDLRANIPNAIAYAQSILNSRDEILSSAKRLAANNLRTSDIRINAAYEDMEKRRQDILTEAQNRADKLLRDAEMRARTMVEQSSIMTAAHNEARSVINEAQAEAREHRLEATAYADELLSSLENELRSVADKVHVRIDKMHMDT